MDNITITQGELTAKPYWAGYHPPEGFLEDNTWHVSYEVIAAKLNQKLCSGPAEVHRDGKSFPVKLEVVEYEVDREANPNADRICHIEFTPIDGSVKDLARKLGLH